MIINADVYLEHHGIKGMHWGIRKKLQNAKGIKPGPRTSIKSLSKSDKRKMLGIAAGVTTIAGASFALAILRNNGHLIIGKEERDRVRAIIAGRKAAHDLIRRVNQLK